MSEEAAISASIADGIASMSRVLNAVNTKLDAVCGAVLDGDDRIYPWDRLSKARRWQVLAVRDHMTDNPRDTLWRSCVATFAPAHGGYHHEPKRHGDHRGNTLHTEDWCEIGASLIGGLVGGLIGASI